MTYDLINKYNNMTFLFLAILNFVAFAFNIKALNLQKKHFGVYRNINIVALLVSGSVGIWMLYCYFETLI